MKIFFFFFFLEKGRIFFFFFKIFYFFKIFFFFILFFFFLNISMIVLFHLNLLQFDVTELYYLLINTLFCSFYYYLFNY